MIARVEVARLQVPASAVARNSKAPGYVGLEQFTRPGTGGVTTRMRVILIAPGQEGLVMPVRSLASGSQECMHVWRLPAASDEAHPGGGWTGGLHRRTGLPFLPGLGERLQVRPPLQQPLPLPPRERRQPLLDRRRRLRQRRHARGLRKLEVPLRICACAPCGHTSGAAIIQDTRGRMWRWVCSCRDPREEGGCG